MFQKSAMDIFAREIVTNARYKKKHGSGWKNMNERLYKINRLFIACDFLIAALGVCVFSYSALHFSKWWIALFALIPLALYMNHGLILDNQITDAKVEELKPKGDDSNARERNS